MSAFKTSMLYGAATALCLAVSAIQAAPIEYRVSFDGTLDNREYGVKPVYRLADETFFFARGIAEAGVAVDGENRIGAGLMPTVWFGAPDTARLPVNALLYFRHESRRTRFRFGAFPRRAEAIGAPKDVVPTAATGAFPQAGALGLPAESQNQTAPPRVGALESLPAWFFGDESAYRRPYVHGAAVDVGGFRGLSAGAWVDWTGLRDTSVNEAFLFGYGLAYAHGAFFARHDFMMYHLALPFNPVPGASVKDNGGASAEIGAAWGKICGYIDTVAASAGVIASLDRDRADMEWRTPAGGFVSGFAGRGMIALRGFYYAGQAQRMAWGESLYNCSGVELFGRWDVIIRFFNKNRGTGGAFGVTNLSAELISSFYLIGEKFGSSQHFVLHADYGTYPK